MRLLTLNRRISIVLPASIFPMTGITLAFLSSGFLFSPSRRQSPAIGGTVLRNSRHKSLESTHPRSRLARGNVVFGERSQEDFLSSGSFPVIDHIANAVGPFDSIGIGNICALIQQQVAVPAFAVVVGKHCGEIVPTLKAMVIHEQQPSGMQTSDEKPGVRSGEH